MEDGEYSGEEIWVELVEIVPNVLQDCKHYVQAEIEQIFSLGKKKMMV